MEEKKIEESPIFPQMLREMLIYHGLSNKPKHNWLNLFCFVILVLKKGRVKTSCKLHLKYI